MELVLTEAAHLAHAVLGHQVSERGAARQVVHAECHGGSPAGEEALSLKLRNDRQEALAGELLGQEVKHEEGRCAAVSRSVMQPVEHLQRHRRAARIQVAINRAPAQAQIARLLCT